MEKGMVFICSLFVGHSGVTTTIGLSHGASQESHGTQQYTRKLTELEGLKKSILERAFRGEM